MQKLERLMEDDGSRIRASSIGRLGGTIRHGACRGRAAACVHALAAAIYLLTAQCAAAQDKNGQGGGDSGLDLPDLVVRSFRDVTAASNSRIRARDFVYLPRQTPSDLLRLVPGIHVQQHTGGGKAHQMFLRGFDAEHGQDLAGFFDGVPLNEVSQVHGQGYLDLHFLIPEVLREISVHKGGYSTLYGNFSTAGAVDFRPDYALEDSLSSLSMGTFDTMRGLALFAGRVGEFSCSAALECSTTSGFTDPGSMDAFRGFASFRNEPCKGTSLRGFFVHYNSEYGAADVLPESRIDAGLVGRFDSMDDSDGGLAVRDMAGISIEHRAGAAAHSANVFCCYKKTEIFSNYTFFLFDRVNGDQHGLFDERTYFGANYAFAAPVEAGGFSFTSRLGLNGRMDVIGLSQTSSKERETVDRINKYDILEGGLGLFAEEAACASGWLRIVAGLRADFEIYGVDGIQDVIEFDIRTNTYVKRDDAPREASAVLAAVSPKASIILTPLDSDEGALNMLRLFANFGMGATPPRAQSMANFQEDSMPRTYCAETAVQIELLGRDMTVQAVAWWADKDSELVFEPESGLSADRGPSRRFGIEIESRMEILPWMYLAADFYWTRAFFRGSGSPIPGTPELMFAGNLSLRHPSGIRAHLKCRAMGPRPLSEDSASRPYWLIDLMLGYEKSKSWRFEIAIENLFNTEWDDTSFFYESRPDPDGPAVPGKHITPGTPFSMKASFTVFF